LGKEQNQKNLPGVSAFPKKGEEKKGRPDRKKGKGALKIQMSQIPQGVEEAAPGTRQS
jgi:hypothetical protein